MLDLVSTEPMTMGSNGSPHLLFTGTSASLVLSCDSVGEALNKWFISVDGGFARPPPSGGACIGSMKYKTNDIVKIKRENFEPLEGKVTSVHKASGLYTVEAMGRDFLMDDSQLI